MINFFKSLFPSNGEKSEDEKNFEIFKYDGIRALRMGKLGYAVKCFEEALKIKTDRETLQYHLAALSANHQTEDALAAASALIEFAPDDAEARLGRAGLYLQSDMPEEALADCRATLGMDLKENTDKIRPLAYHLIGRIMESTKDYAEAIEALTSAIELDANFATPFFLRAGAYYETDRLEDALTDVCQAIELSPDEEANYLLKGKIHEKQSMHADALESYDNALECNPYCEEAILLKSRILISNGEVAEAITFLTEALEYLPNFAPAYLERAKAYRITGNKVSALSDEASAAVLMQEDDEEGTEEDTGFKDLYKGGIY
ncbi:MAG: tetratricopeptide repeat protein [Tannerellaceae bacterium]|jgi:tetratricopeptide (TPR) repeat protein|nr:tetratricopeptide repeat protein [Tannerellaceae bacterium]